MTDINSKQVHIDPVLPKKVEEGIIKIEKYCEALQRAHIFRTWLKRHCFLFEFSVSLRYRLN